MAKRRKKRKTKKRKTKRKKTTRRKKRKSTRKSTKRKRTKTKKRKTTRRTTRKKKKKKTTRRKKAKKKKKKRKGKRRGGAGNAAFMAPLRPSPAFAKVVGSTPLPRTKAVKKLWAYIKKKRLQDKKNKRMINTDPNLKAVFGGKKKVNMFEMMKHLKRHLKKA